DFNLKEKYVAQNVTLEDAFKHMTGLGRHDDIWVKTGISREEVLNQLPNLNFTGSLRERWDYNNLMYLVAGVVTEKISGQSWEESIKKEIFEPLGMHHSYTNYASFTTHEERAVGYAADGVTVVTPLDADAVAPSGAISSTPKDVAKWLEMWVNKGQFQGKPFLAQKEFEYMTSPNENMSYLPPSTVRYYSVGWSGTMIKGQRHIGHAGAGDGQNALIFIRPADGFGIFIMTNQVSDYKYLLQTYAETLFLEDKLERDLPREEEIALVAKFNRFDTILREQGENAALAFLSTLGDVNLEGSINQLGYAYLSEQDMEKALFLMKLNVQQYPHSFNAYDSLGEIYYQQQQYDSALLNYEKSLTLNKENTNAQSMIKRINQEKN
ncbi:MAG: serine hydrolase, partial [Bacteroidota bacterium]